MREVSYSDYLRFLEERNHIVIEDSVIELKPVKITRLYPLDAELSDVSTTVWSFPRRGKWASHKGDYRGNWPPQLVRRVIELFSRPGQLVLDPMIGSGTTCIEARLLGRNCIGVDINYSAAILSLHRLYWLEKYVELEGRDDEASRNTRSTWSRIFHGDSRELSLIKDGEVDLVMVHPPYWNIIRYKHRKTECSPGDLSCAGRMEDYLTVFSEFSREAYRVLKPGGFMAVLIGDTRLRKHYVPISYHVLRTLLDAGFILKEEVIKIQHRMKKTRELWEKVRDRDFLLIKHEKLYILRKPVKPDERKTYKYSSNITFLGYERSEV
ncbi:MAG: DNA methyltransferase [Thermosphaera sp.]